MSNIMIGAVGKKPNQESYKFYIFEQGNINEKSGLAEYKKIKTVNIKRASLESAREFLRKKYSYKNTGKNYLVQH